MELIERGPGDLAEWDFSFSVASKKMLKEQKARTLKESERDPFKAIVLGAAGLRGLRALWEGTLHYSVFFFR